MKAAVIHNFGAPDVLIETYLQSGSGRSPANSGGKDSAAAAEAHALVAKGSIGKNLLKR